MNRRGFLCCTGVLAVTLAHPAGAAQKKNTKIQTKKPASPPAQENTRELELLGLRRPPLFGEGFNLRQSAADAFEAMRHAAKKDGFQLHSVSSFRGFDHQLTIWNRKFRQLRQQGFPAHDILWKIIQYSSIPGSSRHHWGTDLDIIDRNQPSPADPLLAEHFAAGGIYHPLYQWLLVNAPTYGFYEVYTNDPQRTGFAYEPWHWSYSELSIPFLQEFSRIDLFQHLKNSSMEGRQTLTPEIMRRYLAEWGFGVNPGLKA
ncbi:MAG: M15 family metallopeptidase [Candidatus Omnitrophica bacterium]|nr:M15 family metallopeptidase [Candidatus Omnitrophota bacterium]